MAHSAPTIPLFPHADGTQAAVSQWLDTLVRTLQPAVRPQASDPAGAADRLAIRARILRQAGATMLAPVGQVRPAPHLLR